MSESERALVLTEISYRLIAAAERELARAQQNRDTVLAATFAAAGIDEATVLRIDSVGIQKVLYYTVPNGGPPAEGA